MRSRILLVATAVLLFASLTTAQTNSGSITIRVAGQTLVLSPSELEKVTRHDHRVEADTLLGVKLWDLLQLAKAPSPNASGRQRAVMYLKLTGADGQSAVVALVEIDPSFSKRVALVTDRRNGKVLDAAEGPWRSSFPMTNATRAGSDGS